MKYLFTLLFMAILHLNSQLESSLPVDSNYQAFEDEIEEDSHPWPLYVLEDEFNALEIRFPKPPSKSESDYTISYSSVDTDAFPIVFHSLTYSKEPFLADPTEIYEEYLEAFSNAEFAVLKSDYALLEDECHLDFLIIDLKRNIVREEHIVITNANVYYLCSIYFLNTIGNHNAFISTFDIY